MEQATPCKASSFFSEETILFTPLPQATSTVDKRPDLLPQRAVMELKESPEIKSSYLSDGLSTINELRQKLDSLGINNVSNPCSTGTGVADSPNQPVESVKSKLSIPATFDIKDKFVHLSSTGVNADKVSSTVNTSSFKQAMTDITNLSQNYENVNMSLRSSNTSEINLENAYGAANISLPTANRDTSVTRTANLSLPLNSKNLPSTGQDTYSICSSFNPLVQVSDVIKRNTYTLNDVEKEESERYKAREKALKVISSLDVLPAKNSSTDSVISLQQKSYENMTPEKDDSGFSHLMNKSDFQKDESWCAANFGLPIKPGDNSLSFLSASQISLDFMPPDDSLFRELGPAYPPRFHHETLNSELNASSVSQSSFSTTRSENTKTKPLAYDSTMRESTRDVRDLFSELESSASSSFMTGYIKDNLLTRRSTPDGLLTPRADGSLEGGPRVSEIAKALQQISLDATPNSLAKKVMELSDKVSASEDCSLRGYNNSEQCYYERTVVYGGIAHVELPAESATPQTLWSFIDLDSSQVRAVLKTQQSPVKVLMFPFARQDLLVKVQEVDFDRDGVYFSRLHVIRLRVENPQVEIVGTSQLNFGLVPECGFVRLPLTFRSKNSNVVIICPKFDLGEFTPFKIVLDEDSDVEEIHIPPNQDVEAEIVINPINGFCSDHKKVFQICDNLKLCLSSMLGSETLLQLPLKASIFFSSLQIQSHNVEQPISVGEERQISFKNTSPCSFNINITTKGQFNSSVSGLMLNPNEVSSVLVTFIPLQNKDLVDGELLLTVMPGGLVYNIKLQGKMAENDFSFQVPRDLPSRSSSSIGSINSTMNNSSEPEGSLQLECTSSYLIWPSVALGRNSTIKSCFFRPKGIKEKLVIEINDPSNSFYLVTNERERKKSEIIALNPHEKKQISVEFSPKLLGQLRAEVLIKRVKAKEDSECKQVILYGYGGCANLRAHNIVMDLESHHFTLSLQENFSQQFSLQNWGDGIAFFSLSQKKLEGMHLEVSPVRGLVGPGEVRTISLTLQADSSGSQSTLFHKLLTRDKSTDIVLSSLTITYGDESTRLRLARLFKKYKNQPQLKKSSQVTNALKSLAELFPASKQKMECISSLKDPMTSLSDLFDEGIHELTIDVIAQRKSIEDAKLEVTQHFVSFSEAIQLDETEYTTFFDTTHPSHITFN